MAKHYYSSLPCGSGKTHSIINLIKNNFHQNEYNYLISCKSIDLCNNYEKMLTEFNEEVYSIHSQKSDHVLKDYIENFKSKKEKFILIITHDLLQRIIEEDRKLGSFILIVDELLPVYKPYEVKVPHSFETNIKPYCKKVGGAKNTDIYAITDEAIPILKNILKSNDEVVDVLRNVYKCLIFGLHITVTNNELIKTIEVLAQSLLGGFHECYFLAADFEESLFYKLFPYALEVYNFDCRYPKHENGKRLKIYYGFEKKASKNKLSEIIDEKSILQQQIDSWNKLVDSDYIYTTNILTIKNDSKFAFEKLKNNPHGLNQYQHIHNMFISTVNRPSTSDKYFLESVFDIEIDYDILKRDRYLDPIYQMACRTSLRDPNSEEDVVIFVPDLEAAKYLQSKFEGSQILGQLPIMKKIENRTKQTRKKKSAKYKKIQEKIRKTKRQLTGKKVLKNPKLQRKLESIISVLVLAKEDC